MDQYIPAAEPPRGKRTLSAIGAAAGYLGLYFGIRFAVTMILFVIYVFMGIVAYGSWGLCATAKSQRGNG